MKSKYIDEDYYKTNIEQAKYYNRCIRDFKKTLKKNDKFIIDGKRYTIVKKYDKFAIVQASNYQTSLFYQELFGGKKVG